MQSLTSNIKITRVNPGESISGKVTITNFPAGTYPAPIVAYQGQIVQIDPASVAALTHAADDATALKFATGVKGFHLERDIIASETGIPASNFLFNQDFLTPEVISTGGLGGTASGYASARKILECEVEGPDYLIIDAGGGDSTVGRIAGTIAIKTVLSTNGGKLYIAQSGDEPMYRVRGVMQPTITTNTFRLLLEAIV